MLKQIDMIQAKGPEYYNGMVSLVTNSLMVKWHPINKICSSQWQADSMIGPFITSANESILKSAEGLAVTKEEIDLFCEDARKNINNNSMSIGEVMMLRILLPLISMSVIANQTKDQLFEMLAALKQENKL